MRFCMITTFYGAQSFGGDAVYVDRLVRALARRGHEVEVVHCADAFEIVRGRDPLRAFDPPPGVVVHTLHSRLGPLSPIWTHQTGRLGPKGRPIGRLLADGGFDVVHFHNVSLVGGPRVLELAADASSAVRLMTAHEYWLVCPMHVLWKMDREPCEQPSCTACTLRGRRPPQLWRHTTMLSRALEHLDVLICPSRFSIEAHRQRGIDAPFVHLPYFLPDDYMPLPTAPASGRTAGRPYLATAGRLVKAKGFQTLIRLMALLPELDLRIAGTGTYEPELRAVARGLDNVHFEGLLDARDVAELFRDARAVVVPSLFWETFCYVALEAFAAGTPVIVPPRGAPPELVAAGGGGLVCRSDQEVVDAARQLAADDRLRDELGRRGRASVTRLWSEDGHIERYLSLIDEAARRRRERGRPEQRRRIAGSGPLATSLPGR